MKENLIAKGWEMYFECNIACGHKQYFRKKEKLGYEIRVSVKKKTFSILLKNQIIGGPFFNYQLEEKLTQYVQ